MANKLLTPDEFFECVRLNHEAFMDELSLMYGLPKDEAWKKYCRTADPDDASNS